MKRFPPIRFAVLFGLLALSACGFQALHGQAYHDSLAVDLSAISIEVNGENATTTTTSILPHRYVELLKAEIGDGVNPMGVHAEKLFTLSIHFTETDVGLFVNPDGTASRGDLVYSSAYTITRIADAKVVATGTLQRTSSYSTSPTADYASYVAIDDARKRGIIELGQDYKLRLAALLPTLNNPKGSAIAKPVEPGPSNNLSSHPQVLPYETLPAGQ